MTTEPPVLLDAKERDAWDKGAQAVAAISTLRMYLNQYAMAPYGSSLETTEAVRDRIVFFLDEYRRLSSQQVGKYSVVSCGSTAVSGTPFFAIGT